MSDDLSSKAKRVQEFMKQKGFEFKVVELPGSTRTAQEAADSVGCEVGQIAKSLVFKSIEDNIPVLVIASGSNRVDLSKIEEKTGKKLKQANGKFVKEQVGFAIGGIPPAGHDKKLFTILDPDLKKFNRIWAAAGTPFAVFMLNPLDLEPLTQGVWVDLAEI